MKRPKILKSKKIRICISIDEDVFLESANYINNLSGYINSCIKNHITKMKEKEKTESQNVLLCNNKKRTLPINEESIDETYRWW